MCNWVYNQKAVYAPTMMKAPCARLTMFMMPQTIDKNLSNSHTILPTKRHSLQVGMGFLTPTCHARSACHISRHIRVSRRCSGTEPLVGARPPIAAPFTVYVEPTRPSCERACLSPSPALRKWRRGIRELSIGNVSWIDRYKTSILDLDSSHRFVGICARRVKANFAIEGHNVQAS